MTFVAVPAAAYAQATNSPGESPSDTSPTPQQGGPANQPGTNTGGGGENRSNATPGAGATGGGTATPSTPTAGSGLVFAVSALTLLAMGIAAFVVARQKRLHDLGIS